MCLTPYDPSFRREDHMGKTLQQMFDRLAVDQGMTAFLSATVVLSQCTFDAVQGMRETDNRFRNWTDSSVEFWWMDKTIKLERGTK